MKLINFLQYIIQFLVVPNYKMPRSNFSWKNRTSQRITDSLQFSLYLVSVFCVWSTVLGMAVGKAGAHQREPMDRSSTQKRTVLWVRQVIFRKEIK